MDAGDALDERRLAGAVVADEGDDLTGVDVEVDVGQHLHGAEALVIALQLEQRAAASVMRSLFLAPPGIRARRAPGRTGRGAPRARRLSLVVRLDAGVVAPP